MLNECQLPLMVQLDPDDKLPPIHMKLFYYRVIQINFLQTGFALVEVGSVSMKNTKNILTKNLFDACIGALTFYLFGYAFAYGEDNRYIGNISKSKNVLIGKKP